MVQVLKTPEPARRYLKRKKVGYLLPGFAPAWAPPQTAFWAEPANSRTAAPGMRVRVSRFLGVSTGWQSVQIRAASGGCDFQHRPVPENWWFDVPTGDRELNAHSLDVPPLLLARGPAIRQTAVSVGARIGVQYAGRWARRKLRFWERDNAFVSCA